MTGRLLRCKLPHLLVACRLIDLIDHYSFKANEFITDHDFPFLSLYI